MLPLLGEYADAGYRDTRARLVYSFRSNIRYQLTVLACLIVGLVYLFLSTNLSVVKNPKGLVMALAYAWGLILAIYLMGHGLVALPRRLFKGASISGRLRQLEIQAPAIHDRRDESIDELNQLEAQVLQLKQRKNGLSMDFQQWIEELADTSDLTEAQAGQARTEAASGVSIPGVITERYLAELTRKLKRARHKRIRFEEEWQYLLLQARRTHAILDAAGSRKLDASSLYLKPSLMAKLSFLPPTARYYLHAYLIPAGRIFLSVIFALASICIIWSEIFKTKPSLCIVGLSIVHHPSSTSNKIGLAGQAMAAGWLLYMCTAALTSIREVKIWGNRALVRRHTYAESACWYACQVAKLTVPLAYNFVTFVEPTIHERTTFFTFLGSLINLTPLGTTFSRFFPILILVPVLATGFNLYGRVQAVAGFGNFIDDQDAAFGAPSWYDGRALIDRELHAAGAGASAGADALGLSTRDPSPARAPAPERRRLMDEPARSTADTRGARRLEEPDEGNFFTDLAHRMRNTIESADRPAWMKALDTNGGIKRPKWLGGVDGNDESSGRADVGGGLGRWLGGRPDDGRVRL